LFVFWIIPLSAQQKVAPVKSAQTPAKNVKTPAKSTKAPTKSLKVPAKSVKVQSKPVKTTSKTTPVTPKGISGVRKIRLEQRTEAQNSIVLLQNKEGLLPLRGLDTLRTLVVAIGLGKNNSLEQMVKRYVRADYFEVDPEVKPGSIRRQLTLEKYNLVIVAVRDQLSNGNAREKNLNKVDELSALAEPTSLAEDERMLLGEFPPGIRMVYLLFGSKQFLTHWSASERVSAMVVSDKIDFDRFDLSSQLLFGAFSAKGKLPFDMGKFKIGDGLLLPPIGRLSYIIPEEVGIDSLSLAQKMDSLVRIGLKEKAYPGCQMLLAKDGKVFYQRSYGYHTYEQKMVVHNDDLYDLASVTKILAPVPALMMLADQKKFVVSRKMSDYWSDWKGSNKEALLASDVLSHQARLRPGIIVWPKTIDDRGMYRSDYIATKPTVGFELRLSEGLYLKNSFPDTVLKAIDDSPLLKTKKYVYSDRGFVIFPKVIENRSG